MSKWILRFFKSLQIAAEQHSAALFNEFLFERESRAILRLKCESRGFEGEDRQIFLLEESGTVRDLWGKVTFLFCGRLCFGSVTRVLRDWGQVWFGEIVGMTHVGNEEKECSTASSGFVIHLCVTRSGVWVVKQRMWRKTLRLLFLCAKVFLNPILRGLTRFLCCKIRYVC